MASLIITTYFLTISCSLDLGGPISNATEVVLVPYWSLTTTCLAASNDNDKCNYKRHLFTRTSIKLNGTQENLFISSRNSTPSLFSSIVIQTARCYCKRFISDNFEEPLQNLRWVEPLKKTISAKKIDVIAVDIFREHKESSW